jgi:hypothetical protein
MSVLTTIYVVALVNCALNRNPTAPQSKSHRYPTTPQKRTDSDSLRIGTFTVILIANTYSLNDFECYSIGLLRPDITNDSLFMNPLLLSPKHFPLMTIQVHERAMIDESMVSASAKFTCTMRECFGHRCVDVYRAGGHGGQGVNTTDSAVRLTYKAGTPEQIVVTCQNERSQIQNKETAMKVLRGRLLERELIRQREERDRLKGAFQKADFGSQMRSFYLHPYTLVKDHRTDHETSNVQAVLDGGLDPFIDAYLRWNVGRE